MYQRLQKLIAAAGLCSRRRAEEWIAQGKVTVNGALARLGDSADPDRDEILVGGRPLPSAPARTVTVLLYKPRGVVTTLSDERGRRTVADLLPPDLPRLYPVGRLDQFSEGLLLMTNDGALAQRLTHPAGEVRKTYRLWVSGWREAALEALRRPIVLDGRLIAPPQVRLLWERKAAGIRDQASDPPVGAELEESRMYAHIGPSAAHEASGILRDSYEFRHQASDPPVGAALTRRVSRPLRRQAEIPGPDAPAQAFPLGGRCPSAHTGADEGTPRPPAAPDQPPAGPDAPHPSSGLRETPDATFPQGGRQGEHVAELEVTIHEGRNRQIRRMAQAAGLTVTRLKRVAEGSLTLGDLKPGQWRRLTEAELRQLQIDR